MRAAPWAGFDTRTAQADTPRDEAVQIQSAAPLNSSPRALAYCDPLRLPASSPVCIAAARVARACGAAIGCGARQRRQSAAAQGRPDPVLRSIRNSGAETRRNFLARILLIEAGKSFTEIARIWTGDPQRSLALIREVRGGELFEAALASGRGGPHCRRAAPGLLGTAQLLAVQPQPPLRYVRIPAAAPGRPRTLADPRAQRIGRRTGARRRNEWRAHAAQTRRPRRRRRHPAGPATQAGRRRVRAVLRHARAHDGPVTIRLAARTGAIVLFAFAERLAHAQGFMCCISRLLPRAHRRYRSADRGRGAKSWCRRLCRDRAHAIISGTTSAIRSDRKKTMLRISKRFPDSWIRARRIVVPLR